MPKYTVDAAFWHKGLLVPVGSSVTMTEAEAKYRKHALTEEGDKAATVEAPAFEVAEPAPAPVLAAVVQEKPVTGHGKRRRHAESQHADSSN
ncbi:hypothetical protein V1279_003058 [Bradyrhizobium sp. AZCC 1610]|uniref:hypothetical protein n=1 Tax=Bradyrhizobium sp. AZCC 1610 TaxID=3117020 RepID=UPI002FEFFEB0